MNRPRQTIIAVSLGFALAIGHSVPTLALEPPGEPEIKSALEAELLPYWSIDSVGIFASVNDGDEVSPRYRQRFVANAVPNEELYLRAEDDGSIGPFAVLVTTRTTTQVHKLYGIATSVLALGKWSTELVMENSVEGLGMPRSLFSGSVVVAGSAQADQAASDLLEARESALRRHQSDPGPVHGPGPVRGAVLVAVCNHRAFCSQTSAIPARIICE